MKKFSAICLLFVCGWLSAVPSSAQNTGAVKKIENPEKSINGTTYLALLRTLFPDGEMKNDEFSFQNSISARCCFDDEKTDAEIKKVVHLSHRQRLKSLQSIRFKTADGKDFLLLLIVSNSTMPLAGGPQEKYTLAAFRLASGESILVDAVNPQQQRITRSVGFWNESPFLQTKEINAFWLRGSFEDSREKFEDFQLTTIEGDRFRAVIDRFPQLRSTREDCFQILQNLGVSTGEKLRFEITEKKRILTNANCRERRVVEHDKIDSHEVVWNEEQKRYRLDLVSSRTTALSEAKEYDGELNVGETYRADVEYRENEWRLVKALKLPMHHAYRVEWLISDGSARFPAAAAAAARTGDDCRRSFEFKILSREITAVVPNKRWNTVFKAAVVSSEKCR